MYCVLLSALIAGVGGSRARAAKGPFGLSKWMTDPRSLLGNLSNDDGNGSENVTMTASVTRKVNNYINENEHLKLKLSL